MASFLYARIVAVNTDKRRATPRDKARNGKLYGHVVAAWRVMAHPEGTILDATLCVSGRKPQPGEIARIAGENNRYSRALVQKNL